MKIKPGDVFRVSDEKRLPKEGELLTWEDGRGFSCANEDWEHSTRYILEPIDPSRVTIAEGPKPVEPVAKKWFVDEEKFTFTVRCHAGGGTIFYKDHHPDARERAQAECDRLNERDTPKARYEVRSRSDGEYWIRRESDGCAVVGSISLNTNRKLADAVCKAFNEHAKD